VSWCLSGKKVTKLNSEVKKDLLIILVLVVFILLFWLPAFLKWVPLLGDDYIYHDNPAKNNST